MEKGAELMKNGAEVMEKKSSVLMEETLHQAQAQEVHVKLISRSSIGY